MELDEFHIAEFSSRAPRGGQPVAGRSFGVCALRIDLRASTGGQERRFGIATRNLVVMLKLNSSNAIAINNEIAKKSEWCDFYSGTGPDAREERIHDDFSG
jgi:hypothetical protein